MILVEADVDEEWDSCTDWAALADKAARAAIAQSSYSELADSAVQAELSVKFTTDEEVRELNAAYRNKDKPTNVLSFPMMEAELLASAAAMEEGELLLGDVVLAAGICAAEARDKGIAVEDHAAHLVVHGSLHVLGYDHETGDDDAAEMEALERAALASIGIDDPYRADING